MNGGIAKAISEASKAYPKADKFVGYGTAGFRDKENVLDHVMFRMGILANLRSKVKQAAIGVMITASHNPEGDNGVKLVDPAGEMLENEWEKIATEIANVENDKLVGVLGDLISKCGIDMDRKGSVVLARDTRKSSPRLSEAVEKGFRCVDQNGDLADFGLATTPQLHYLVVCKNSGGATGEPSITGYYDKLSTAFPKICDNPLRNGPGNYTKDLIIDCANGVGAAPMKHISERLKKYLDVTLVNDGSSGELNHDCGADFVKVLQKKPLGVTSKQGIRCASLDGDADRLIYFYFDEQEKFFMLDGDKIAVLMADHLRGLIKEAGIEGLTVGLVQSAYANGSSTDYASNTLGIPVVCVPTGVKFLHHAAQEFDIGVYFEANGHGTVVFSDKAAQIITAPFDVLESPALAELAGFYQLINSYVGDAIADLLVVEAILLSKGWNAKQWDDMYHDLPNRQLKVLVADRTVVTTADAERKCVTPEGLQDKIDAAVKKYPKGRSFVRPSGTEDVVRVYAESDTQENADRLAKDVSDIVSKECGGRN